MSAAYERAQAELDALVDRLDATPAVADRGWLAGERVDPTTHVWGEWPMGDGLYLRAWPVVAPGAEFEIEVSRKRGETMKIADVPPGTAHQTIVEQLDRAFGPVALTDERLVTELEARGVEAHLSTAGEVMVVAPWSDEFLVVDVERLALFHSGARLPVEGDLVDAIVAASTRSPATLEANREARPLTIAEETVDRVRSMLRLWNEGAMAIIDATQPLAPVAAEAELLDDFRAAGPRVPTVAEIDVEVARGVLRVLQRARDRASWRGWTASARQGVISFDSGPPSPNPKPEPSPAASAPTWRMCHWLSAWPTADGWRVVYEGAPIGRPRHAETPLAFEPGPDVTGDQLGVVLGAFLADFALQCQGIGTLRSRVLPHGQLPPFYNGHHVFYQAAGAADGPIGHWRVRSGRYDWLARPVLPGHLPGGIWSERGASPRLDGPALIFLGSVWGGQEIDDAVVEATQRRPPPGWSHYQVEKSLGRTGLGCWPIAVEQFTAGETETQAKRRAGRSAKRLGLTVWVPPVDAPRSTQAGTIDAQGSTAGAWSPGRKRSEVPMRMVMALWGLGFGVEVMERIAELADATASKSALHRLLKQGRDPGDRGWGVLGAERAGAVQATIGELVTELRAESAEADLAGCRESGVSDDPPELAEQPRAESGGSDPTTDASAPKWRVRRRKPPMPPPGPDGLSIRVHRRQPPVAGGESGGSAR